MLCMQISFQMLAVPELKRNLRWPPSLQLSMLSIGAKLQARCQPQKLKKQLKRRAFHLKTAISDEGDQHNRNATEYDMDRLINMPEDQIFCACSVFYLCNQCCSALLFFKFLEKEQFNETTPTGNDSPNFPCRSRCALVHLNKGQYGMTAETYGSENWHLGCLGCRPLQNETVRTHDANESHATKMKAPFFGSNEQPLPSKSAAPIVRMLEIS